MRTVAERVPETGGETDVAANPSILAGADLETLFTALRAEGYRMIGPTLVNGAIAYAEISFAAQLPQGDDAEQSPGAYALTRRDDGRRFAGAVGPVSWKRFLYPPDQLLWRARRSGDNGDLHIESLTEDESPLAFVGVRACDLAAIQIQDRVYLGQTGAGAHDDASGLPADLEYARRREQALIIAVNCTAAADTCFCASLGTGPQTESGFDLALTEMTEPAHQFLVDIGSKRGARIASHLPLVPATDEEVELARTAVWTAAQSQGRTVAASGLKERLQQNLDHPHWDVVAERCLSCGNCTMVCPTCFCMSIEDSTDLSGDVAERRRLADSCFNISFAYVNGGSLRTSTRGRYRQWLTHKFAGWVDQFGTLGCVGCGRCITWCPAGIDITAEVAQIRATEQEVGNEYGPDPAAAND